MPTLRLQQLYAFFLLLSLVLLAALGLYAHLSFQHVIQQTQEDAERAARAEVASAVAALERRLRNIAGYLASWDETRQHLTNPEYYPLWRDTRVRDSGALPASMRIGLYRPNGVILARDPSGAFPDRLPPQAHLEVRLMWQDARPVVHYPFPIRVHPDSELLLGYGLIRLEPVEELRKLGPFRYVDDASLRLRQGAEKLRRLDELTQYLDLRAQPNTVLLSALNELEQLIFFAIILSFALALAFFVTLRQMIVRPVRRLTSTILHLRDDPQAEIHGSINHDFYLWELKELQNAFLDYNQRLLRLHREVQQSSEIFYRQARQDPLTGVYNRRAFDEDRARLEHDKRIDECTLILFDCDHFKAINDTYGHPVGDAVIRALATCLTQALRADDRLYRLGGDEFATLMPGVPIDTARVVAERCLEQVRQYDFSRLGISEPVTISIGLAHASAPFDLTTLHRHADLAMYSAKRPGHPKIAIYEESLGALAALVSNREVSAVYAAIRQPDLLHFRYQPVVRLPQRIGEYCEALCRIHCDGQVIAPGAIFAIVQARRLDVEFDLAVIEAVRRDLRQGLPELEHGVSINISAPGIVNDQVISALLSLKADSLARKIVVEITETALITQVEAASANIARLRAAGCLVALDDFGSGYSSLRYLASMPVDMVKFDMSLIRLLEKDDLRERLIVQDIAQIVATAGYDLVAEGIENEVLLAQVEALGFTYAQGYHLDRLHAFQVRPQQQTATQA